MTGEDVKGLFNTQIGETGSGYEDDTALNNLFRLAVYNVITKEIDQFQRSNSITRDLQPILRTTSTLTPVNATIDISPTSVAVTDFFSFGKLKVTAPYRGANISNYAKERQEAQFKNSYTQGDARFPRYYFEDQLIIIEPSNVVSAVLTYFTTPQEIDVTDNSTEIIYNTNLITRIITEAISLTAVQGRDSFMVQATNVEQQKNTLI